MYGLYSICNFINEVLKKVEQRITEIDFSIKNQIDLSLQFKSLAIFFRKILCKFYKGTVLMICNCNGRPLITRIVMILLILVTWLFLLSGSIDVRCIIFSLFSIKKSELKVILHSYAFQLIKNLMDNPFNKICQ